MHLKSAGFKQLANLLSNGFGVLGVAGKHPHRRRRAFGTGEQSDHHLLLAFFAVPVVTESGQDVKAQTIRRDRFF